MVPLQVNQLVAGYGHQALIRNLSFIVPRPAFVAVIGHNGSGKSTLLKALTGQIAHGGEVRIGEQRVQSGQNPSAAGLLSFLAQKNHVNFSLPVRELVVMGSFRRKRFFQPYTPADYADAGRALAALQITHLADADYQHLSGGEQQMVWLAQLLVQNAGVILLDEPTQQLDVYNRKKVFDLMAGWVQQDQKTVLCVTHDIHNLFAMRGYLLNLSSPAPALEEITEETVSHHLALLEHKR
ncbi:MAG: ABC transporter ATP-binding protein [Cytophagales bacterium]|nr:ABC transporter ATP-binding protein [Cytophagales bacterium]